MGNSRTLTDKIVYILIWIIALIWITWMLADKYEITWEKITSTWVIVDVSAENFNKICRSQLACPNREQTRVRVYAEFTDTDWFTKSVQKHINLNWYDNGTGSIQLKVWDVVNVKYTIDRPSTAKILNSL
jgi:hypothetical protein